LATWNVQQKDFQHIAKIKEDAQLLTEVDVWRKKLNMPEWVALEDGDNDLVIKLSNLLSVKTLISMVKKRQSFVLKEFFEKDENMVVRNEEGAFTNEIIFSFYKEN
jgi:lantibiotic biosynthesis protein